MSIELTYEKTIELEENIKIKNQADKIYADFLKNIKLEPKNYKGNGRFLYWSDQYNQTYISLVDDKFVLQCRFLHESYDVEITPSSIFNALKNKYRGADHLYAYCSII